MNIKLKAALEVAVFIASAIFVGSLVQLFLNYLSTIYTKEQIASGIVFVLVSTASFIAVSVLYDIRVAQLKYKEKLTEMVKK
jgi:ABC-type uncharacterized transport system permease subunit